MKWVEIITLRSLSIISKGFFDELLRQEGEADTTKRPLEVRVFHNSFIETDVSIHIHWESESGRQHKSPLGQRLFYALKDFGLLNHSVWVETSALKYVTYGDIKDHYPQGHEGGGVTDPDRPADSAITKIATKRR
jgi:hypothetical protein